MNINSKQEDVLVYSFLIKTKKQNKETKKKPSLSYIRTTFSPTSLERKVAGQWVPLHPKYIPKKSFVTADIQMQLRFIVWYLESALKITHTKEVLYIDLLDLILHHNSIVSVMLQNRPIWFSPLSNQTWFYTYAFSLGKLEEQNVWRIIVPSSLLPSRIPFRSYT